MIGKDRIESPILPTRVYGSLALYSETDIGYNILCWKIKNVSWQYNGSKFFTVWENDVYIVIWVIVKNCRRAQNLKVEKEARVAY